MITDADALSTALRQGPPVFGRAPCSLCRICLGVSWKPLGATSTSNPMFFRGHISDYLWYNTRDRRVEFPGLQSAAGRGISSLSDTCGHVTSGHGSLTRRGSSTRCGGWTMTRITRSCWMKRASGWLLFGVGPRFGLSPPYPARAASLVCTP